MYGRGDKAEPIAIAVVIAVCVVLAISAIYVVDSSAATTGPTKAISERVTDCENKGESHEKRLEALEVAYKISQKNNKANFE